jgi:hypothetical protein
MDVWEVPNSSCPGLDSGPLMEVGPPRAHPLAEELEERMTNLLRLHVTDRQILSPQAPDKLGYHGDACSMLALAAWGAKGEAISDILVL